MQPGGRFLAGSVSMGLVANWILFFPYFGPALNATSGYSLLPHVFTLTHIMGMFHSTCNLVRPGPGFSRHHRISPYVVAILTALFPFISFSPNLALFSFIMMGITSGWIAGRWMAWFSSPVTCAKRGTILGLSIAVSYTLLSLDIIVMSIPTLGVRYSFLISSLTILTGGLIMNRLPVVPKDAGPPPIRSMAPPKDLLLFGIFAYAIVSLIYHSIWASHIRQPVLPWLALMPYLITGIFLGKRSDQMDRYYLTIIAFLVIGLGFLMQAVSPTGSVSTVVTSILVLTGLMCIHLFYWLSLADRQIDRYAPFQMVTGVSVELVSCAVVFSLVPFIPPSPEIAGKIVGITGVGFILLGFFVISWNNHHVYSKICIQNSHAAGRIDRRETLTPLNSHNFDMPLPFYFQNTAKESIDRILFERYHLTGKEAEVAYLMFIGYKNAEITKSLYISPNTLKFHIKNIYSKIGVSSRDEASALIFSSIHSAN